MLLKDSALTRNLKTILTFSFAIISALVTLWLIWAQPFSAADDAVTQFMIQNHPVEMIEEMRQPKMDQNSADTTGENAPTGDQPAAGENALTGDQSAITETAPSEDDSAVTADETGDSGTSVEIGELVDTKLQAVVFAIFIFISYILLAQYRRWITILFHIISLIAATFIVYYFNSQGMYVRLLMPMLGIFISMSLFILQSFIISYAERVRVTKTLEMYVDPKVAARLAETNPAEIAKLSSRRDIAVLFVDIRGFTSMSESLQPEQVVEILNEYLSHVANAIAHWGGTLDKFIGDAAMAVFNSPEDLDHYVLRAACAAKEIVDGSEAIRQKYLEKYHREVGFGVGINCGEAVVGNIGSFRHMDFTAIGDTVNTASRLEGKAKAGQILVSRKVKDALQDEVACSSQGLVALKGKSQEVETFQIDEILVDTKALEVQPDDWARLERKTQETMKLMEQRQAEAQKKMEQYQIETQKKMEQCQENREQLLAEAKNGIEQRKAATAVLHSEKK